MIDAIGPREALFDGSCLIWLMPSPRPAIFITNYNQDHVDMDVWENYGVQYPSSHTLGSIPNGMQMRSSSLTLVP